MRSNNSDWFYSFQYLIDSPCIVELLVDTNSSVPIDLVKNWLYEKVEMEQQKKKRKYVW